MMYSQSEPYELEEIPDRFARITVNGAKKSGDVPSDEAEGDLSGFMDMDGVASGETVFRSKGRLSLLKEAVLATTPAPPPGAAGETAALRQWFPEAFLWQPLVETDAGGTAEVDVRVPDQLTTWRVLALAHDRRGHQAGAVHTFEGTLPAYVDPVVPGWMFQGDEIAMPVQVVNNAGEPLSGRLRVSADDAVRGALDGELGIGPFGSAVRSVSVVARSVGTGRLAASLEGVDALKKDWPVHPTGRPVRDQRGGTLTGSRTIELEWPADARASQLSVAVHPGPLSVLSSELERLSTGGPGAYGYGVVHQTKALAVATGATLEAGALRKARIRSWQRLVREARSPNTPKSADLLLGLGAAEHGALLKGMRARLVRTVVAGQRGDGTWARADRGTLQRVVVQTAFVGRVLPESETGARLRAEGALERYQPQIDDPYTAAVVLVSGLSSFDDSLLALVREGIVEVEGRQTVAIPKDTQSIWGGPPSRTEMLAWTALALQPHEPDLAGDLVSELMMAYSVERGFGAGPADALALEAVVKALPAVDTPVQLSLAIDGEVVSRGVVDPSQPRVPAMLLARPTGPMSTMTLTAEPASAGLSFVASQRSWVPWTGKEGIPGIDVEVSSDVLRAGIEGQLLFTIAAPSGSSVRMVQGLPAGVTVDREALSGVTGVVSSVVHPDRVEIVTHAFGAGELLEIPLAVTPTYAGRMVSRALEIEAGGRSEDVAPFVWNVTP